MKMRKIASLMMLAMLVFGLVACNNTPKDEGNNQGVGKEVNSFDKEANITVVSREDGSGTRGAFIEITKVLEKADGNEVDKTTVESMIQNSTNGVMTAVAGDVNGIGYISLGSLNDTVKALKIEGMEASSELVKDGSYKLARPFNIAWKSDTIGEIGEDLKKFILSTEGQKIVEEKAYVSVGQGETYTAPEGLSGQVTVAGSTSVTPLMEKLVEAYTSLNPGVTIDIQSTGSSAGMTSAMDGTANLGMASRDLKDEEKASLESTPIAIDGIAVIVNNANPIEEITMEQIRQIFVGEIKTWSQVE